MKEKLSASRKKVFCHEFLFSNIILLILKVLLCSMIPASSVNDMTVLSSYDLGIDLV